MAWVSRWCCAVVLSLVCVFLCRAQVRPPETPAGEILAAWPAREAILDYAALAAKQDRFSGSILIARHDKVLLEKSYGLADRPAVARVRADTRFRIGSMNKMFTAVATLQLVESGELRLDESIGTYLSDYPIKSLLKR